MADEEKPIEQPQDDTPEIPEVRPMFAPEMIVENAMESDFITLEDDLNDNLEKSDE